MGQGDHLSGGRWLYGSTLRRILVQRQVRACRVIVAQVGGDDPSQMLLAEHDHVIKALTPDGTDQTLRVRILPRRPPGDQHLINTHPVHPSLEVITIDAVAITEAVTGRRVPGECLHDLLCRPRSRGLLGDVELDDATTMVREHDEGEEDSEGDGGHGEEIHGHQVVDVIGKEGTTRL